MFSTNVGTNANVGTNVGTQVMEQVSQPHFRKLTVYCQVAGGARCPALRGHSCWRRRKALVDDLLAKVRGGRVEQRGRHHGRVAALPRPSKVLMALSVDSFERCKRGEGRGGSKVVPTLLKNLYIYFTASVGTVG